MSEISQPKKKLYSVSPSQVSTYRQCPRLWFWASVLNDRGLSSRANVRGDAVHKALEHYMSTGEIWPTVELLAPYLPPVNGAPATEVFQTLEYIQVAIDHLPPIAIDPYWATLPEGHGVMVEQAGEMGTYEAGPAWVQYIDLVIAQPGDVGEILDYKTRSDFRYNKTPAELAHDVQLMSNARWLFLSSDYKEIRLKHLNLLTRGKVKCVPTFTTVTRDQVEEIWQQTLATVREMEQWAAIASEADKLPPNTESCNMYGGCRKKSACGFDKPVTLRRLSAMSSEPNPLLLSLLAGKGIPAALPTTGLIGPSNPTAVAVVPVAPAKDLLGSLLAPRTAAPAPAAVAPPSPPAPAAVVPPVGPVVSSLSALLNPAKAAEPLPVVVPPSAFQAAAVAAGYPVDFKPTGSISPPDAPPRTSTPEQVAEADAGNKEKPEAETEEDDDKTKAVPTCSVCGALQFPTPSGVSCANGHGEAPPAELPATGRRRRRTKAEMEAARAAAAARAAEPDAVVARAAEAEVFKTPAAGLPTLTGLLAQVAPAVINSIPEVTAAALAGAGTTAGPSVADIMAAAQAGNLTVASQAITGDLTSPAPVDPVVAQIQHRLKTADPQFACATKFVFIDCMPGKGWAEENAPVDAREFWHAITGNASAAAKVADYRFIKYESKAFLSASVRVMLKGLPTCIYVDSSIPDIQELLTAVIPYASLVVHGR